MFQLGIPLTINAEALACGTPVISCSRGALPEIVRHGVDGYLVQNQEEAVSAIEQLANINRHVCRQRAEQCFSASVIVEQYEKLYQRFFPLNGYNHCCCLSQ